MMEVRFYFDPACPWTWITSRWMVEVAPQRDLTVRWETFSLLHRNRDNPAYDWVRDELHAQYPSLRIIEAARNHIGNDGVDRIYTSLGTLIHHDGDSNLDRLAEAVASAGLDPEFLAAGHDPSFDAAIIASTEEGWRLIGDDGGIPLIVIPGQRAPLFGPVLSPAPTGPDALDLWDTFVSLGRFNGLYEIKRSRATEPQFGARPPVFLP